MSGAEGLPLKIIDCKVAAYGGEGYDTGIRVTEEDLREAKKAIRDIDSPDDLRHFLIASCLIKKFRDRIKATVVAQPGAGEYDSGNWLIQDGELINAINRIVEQ